MRFFLDHNVPVSVADVLIASGHDVIVQKDALSPAAPDDEIISQALARQPNHAKLLGWNDRANPGLMTLPIVGAEWYRTAGLYPGWFPYWFYDTWVAEVYSYVTGELPILPEGLRLVAKKGVTQRMRDLSFWWDFYTKLRPERIEEAKRIRELQGVSITDERLNNAIRYWDMRDLSFKPRIPYLEGEMTGFQMPSDRYMVAKSAAGRKLQEMLNG